MEAFEEEERNRDEREPEGVSSLRKANGWDHVSSMRAEEGTVGRRASRLSEEKDRG